MNLSGILVVTEPQNTAAMIDVLNAQPGLEVHHHEAATGRIIVVQEAATINDEVAGLRQLKKIPGVVFAEMVYHYFAEDEGNCSPQDPDACDEDARSGIPVSLNT